MRRKLIVFISIILAIFVFSNLKSTVFAKSDFNINSEITLDYRQGNNYVSVIDEVTFRVDNEDYYLRKGATQTFYIPDFTSKNIQNNREFKKNSILIKDSYDNKLKYTITSDSKGMYLEIKTPKQISSFEEYSIILTYKSKDLVNLSGNIANLYLPGLPNNTKFTEVGSNGLTTTKTFKSQIITSKDVPLPSYTQPTNIKLTQKDKENIYEIQAVDRIGKTSWLQFGTTQYYKFKLVQQALKTDTLTPTQISKLAPIVSTNVYKIALPREYDENAQSILIKSIQPQPKYIEIDKEGNLIATFDTPANINSEIVIEGLITVSQKQFNNKLKLNDLNLADYKSQVGSLEQYLKPEKYIESEDTYVVEIANKLYEKSSSIMELINNDYNYIVNKFNYSQEKLTQGNLRLGAKAALSGSQTICMEYADSLIAILRAQGIPARTAIGYGNDPHNAENSIDNMELKEQLIGHQWVQVWIPDYGWLSVDPTWGESNRTYIGSDLDHILWYTQSPSTNDITDVIFYSAEKSSLGKYQIFLQALTEEKFNQEKKGATTLAQLNIKEKSSELPIDFYLKTSVAGKIFIYLIPILATLVVSIVVTSVVYYVKGKVRKNSQT